MIFPDRFVAACALVVVSILCLLALMTSQTLAGDAQTLGVLFGQQTGVAAGA